MITVRLKSSSKLQVIDAAKEGKWAGHLVQSMAETGKVDLHKEESIVVVVPERP